MATSDPTTAPPAEVAFGRVLDDLVLTTGQVSAILHLWARDVRDFDPDLATRLIEAAAAAQTPPGPPQGDAASGHARRRAGDDG